MRKTLESLGTLLGGAVVLASVVLLFYARIDKMLLIAGGVGLVVGLAIFSLFRPGRTWPARAALVALAAATLGLCQTAPQWLPYLRADEGGFAGESPAPPGPDAIAQPGVVQAGNRRPQEGSGTKAKPGGEHPFEEAAKKLTLKQFLDEHLEPALKTISAKKGYTCTFHKREWCKGLIGDERLTDETLSMKIRHEPFSVYLYFQQPKRGTEALYVEGANGGNVIAHSTVFPGSLLGTIRVPPTDSKVMADNRYPITSIGLTNLLLKLKRRAEEHKGEFDWAFSLVDDRKVDERPCKCIELYNPQPDAKVPLASARLYIDAEWNVPVGFESYEKRGGKSQLVEYYRYTKLKFDPGLKDIDFDPANPEYGYSK